MVRVFALEISHMADPKEDKEILGQLSARRREQVMRCAQLKGRKEAAGAGLLLREVFSLYDVSEEDIFYGDNGKPMSEKLCFNLSHTEGMVICAVSDREVGCDIENLAKTPGKVAKRFFTQKENQYLNEVSEEKRNREFFRIWTMKESYIKMTGEGMKVAFQSLEIEFVDDNSRNRNEKTELFRDGVKQFCFLKEYEIPGYQVSVCSKESDFADTVTFETFNCSLPLK